MRSTRQKRRVQVLLARFDVAYAAEALEQDGLPLVSAQEVQRVKQDALLLRVLHGLLGGHHVHAQRHLHPSLVGRVGRKSYEVDLAIGFFLFVQAVHRQIAGDHSDLSGIHDLADLGEARREIAFHHDPSIVELLENLVVRFKQPLTRGFFVDHIVVPSAFFRGAEQLTAGQTQANVLHGIFQAGDEGTDAFGCDDIAKVVELGKGCRDFPAVLLEEHFVVEDALYGAVDGQLPQCSVNAQLFKRRKVVAAREPFRGQIVRVFARPHAHAAENQIGQVVSFSLLFDVRPHVVGAGGVDEGEARLGYALAQGLLQRLRIEYGVATYGDDGLGRVRRLVGHDLVFRADGVAGFRLRVRA